MKKGTLGKKAGSILLAATMIVTSFPAFRTEVHAANLPDITQFAAKEELKSFNTDDSDGSVNPAKVYFGSDSKNNKQQWWIAGSQNGNLTLFAASPLEVWSDLVDQNNKTYDAAWGCVYPDGAPTEVYAHHYGAHVIRTSLKEAESLYFSPAERLLMNDTTVYTYDDKNDSVYSTTDRLYLAYGDDSRDKNTYITVGTNGNSADSLNSGLRIDKSYWQARTEDKFHDFMLRAPHVNATPMAQNGNVLIANETHGTVMQAGPYTYGNLVAAFEFDLSSVLLASAAPAANASNRGKLTLGEAMTLRYADESLGSAVISADKTKVEYSGLKWTNDTYLVVQNDEGAWAQKLPNYVTSLSASAMGTGLTSFENCKIWLERTDTTENKTYAKMAESAVANSYTVNITLGSGMQVQSGSLTQQVDKGQPMTAIVIQATDNYKFSADYSVAAQNGITVTRDSDSQITVSGTPTADVNLTLPAATQKAYGMELSGNGTFGSVCVGYAPDKVAAQDFTITNTGNVELTNVQVTIGGTDSSDFALSWDDKVTTIRPNGTIEVTVKPKDSLAVKEYQAQLSVSAENCNPASKTLQFTVAEHDYEWTYNNDAACEKNGTETGVCKDCGDKTTREKAGTALEHQPSDWIIDTAATETSDGKKHKECTVCGKVLETETIPATGTPGGRHKILEGADQTWKGSGSLTIKANGDFAKFTGIKVDGTLVDVSHYDAKSGSTVVTLKESYLATLSARVHTLTFVYDDGEVSTHFMIADKETSGTPEIPDNSTKDNQNTGNRTDTGSSRSPQTGDKTNISLYLLLLLMSGLMIAFCVEWKKIKSKC